MDENPLGFDPKSLPRSDYWAVDVPDDRPSADGEPAIPRAVRKCLPEF
jgi:hypothetical protein